LREKRRLRVYENKVLRKIFGPKRDEVRGEWKKLHNEGISDLYSSPNIFRVIKLRRMRWAVHVALIGERRGVSRVLVGNPSVRDHVKDPCVDGRIILRWIFRKWDEGAWTGLMWLRIRKVVGTCKCDNASSGSIKCGEFLDYQRTS
jgi:hypothetical protein